MSDIYMIHEVMSRARMLEPQTIPSEASRSARQIMVRARKRARELSQR
ncbi:hypothetical protein GCM10009679_07730 [Saccharothrix algeriensis]|uniref:Uncharacterized protein n=1 Tax=Catellatospora bangladeshensis TaxID=310355 RepID=A0A8J3JIZ4_9ACTN|nr:hypothetical protein Cba03nite_12690 [Catellatospora bangladeshensis]